jgi:L-fuconolactonase
MDDWSSLIRGAAAHANVAAKISGLNTILATTTWKGWHFREAVEIALDCFGPDRLMCGSDWPVSLLNGDYEKVWSETAGIVVAVAGEGAATRILEDTPTRLYRIGRETEAEAAVHAYPGEAHGRSH